LIKAKFFVIYCWSGSSIGKLIKAEKLLKVSIELQDTTSDSHRVENSSGAHPPSYPMGTRGSFLEGKAAGT
jgi:hypothetical protein